MAELPKGDAVSFRSGKIDEEVDGGVEDAGRRAPGAIPPFSVVQHDHQFHDGDEMRAAENQRHERHHFLKVGLLLVAVAVVVVTAAAVVAAAAAVTGS